ncbi:MAG: hypothetical protein WCQ95_12560 [Bacteroidota bacterium]
MNYFTLATKLFLLYFLTILFSCTKEESFPPEPYIEYLSFAKIQNSSAIDNKGILKIYFTDGDGDIGLSKKDTIAPFDKSSTFYYNFFITYFEKQHGQFIKVIPSVTFNSRIPVLTPTGNNKSLKGEIEIEVYFNNPFSLYDTIKFEANIADRALHISNTIITPEIVVKKN